MEPEELEILVERLKARRAELVALGDEVIAPNRTDAVSVPDEDTQPLNEMNQVIASKRNKARALELERIEVALRQIAHSPDDFGECDACGEAIALKRLEVVPWARRCVRCEDRLNPRVKSRRRHIFDYDD